MRTVPRVRLGSPSAPALLFSALLFSASCLGPPAASFESETETPSDIEEPADIAPEGIEAPPGETQPSDDLLQPRELDRGVFRPDLKPGSEGAAEPRPAEESKEDRLGAQPDDLPLSTPADKPKVLGELYVQLAKAKDAEAAVPIMTNIETLWRVTGSATVDLLIGRAELFTKGKDLDLALQILDATVAMAPEEAEPWYLRAKVYYAKANYDLALADLKRALDRDPKHYRALEDLGLVYDAFGRKPDALEAYRKALAVNPFLTNADMAVKFLEKEVGARNL
jgi:tetratricopeptide (TPR) repeat protein